MKAALVFDGGGPNWTETDVQSVMANVQDIRRSLRRLGHSTTLIPVRLHDLKWLSRVQRVDVVFNLIEGIDGQARFEDWAVGALELTGVPFTGCRASAVSLCHRKHVANTLMARAGLPVPAFALGKRNQVPDGLRPPVIVKPSGEDASVGIDGGAICTTRKAVRERLARMSEQFREVVVQEYIEGREFNVGFLGRTALPLSEISFAEMPEGYWRIVSYAAKWAEGSPEYVGTTPVCPAQVDGALADRIISVARQAWELLGGGEGYGRVDIRVAADGTPYVLEVNPNPDLSTDAGYAGMGRALGWDYDALVSRLVEEALNRARDGAAADSLVREVTG